MRFYSSADNTFTASGGRGKWVTLAAGAFLIYLAFLPPGIYSIDGNSMLAVSDSLLHGSIQVSSPDLGTRGRNGALYSNWYPLQSIVSLPLVALGAATAHLLHLPTHYLEAVCALLIPGLCTAGTVALVALLAQQLGADEQPAFLAGLVYGFGTIALVYTREYFAEPLLALVITAALYFAFERRTIPAAVLAALAVLAKPPGVIVGPLISAYLLAKSRRQLGMAAIPAIGSSVGLGLYVLYNAYRFGHPLAFGQPWAFAVRHIPQGLAGLLVSPGWGLLWFSPAAVFGLAAIPHARKRWEALTILCLFAFFVGLHSLWEPWQGGWSWGPRLILPALPGLVSLSALLSRSAKKAVLALALVTLTFTVPNMFSFYERFLAESSERGVTLSELAWSPTASPLVHAWPAAFRQSRDAAHQDVRALFAASGTPASRIASSRALRIVAVWWWVLPIAHVPRALGAALSALLLIAGIVLVLTKWYANPHPDAEPKRPVA